MLLSQPTFTPGYIGLVLFSMRITLLTPVLKPACPEEPQRTEVEDLTRTSKQWSSEQQTISQRGVCGCADRAGRRTARCMAERVDKACMATAGRMTPRRMATKEGGLSRMATRGGLMATWGELTRMAARGGLARMTTRGLTEGPPRTGTGARTASAVHGEPSTGVPLS